MTAMPLPRSCFAALLTLLLLVSMFDVGPASAQHFGRNKIQYENFDWQILSTPHFEIFFYSDEQELAARTAVIAEDAYNRLSETFDHELSTQIPFILYASPNDFQQTNVSPGLIGEGTGGFSEPLRNRVVLPYPGDNQGFVHVINHEMVHVFMFDIVYHSTQKGSRRQFFPLPLWFAEGAAEWFSTGWDQAADMWLRDATIYDYTIPLPRAYGGFFGVYKQGQSAMRYIARTYGDDKVVDLFKEVGRTRDVNAALVQTLGVDQSTFSEHWIKSLKQEYWSLYSHKQEPDAIGRRLTNHAKEGNYFFQQPVLSPNGEYVAFFSDVEGFVSLYVSSVEGGDTLRKLVTGYRSNDFLTLHSFNSSIGFSPDSDEVCFVAKSGQDEVLYVVGIEDGGIEKSIALNMDIARSPAWSPVADEVVLSGTRGGQTDLYLVDLDSGRVEPLTDDVGDEHSPAWYPDGSRILFSGFPDTFVPVAVEANPEGEKRLTPVDFTSRTNVRDVRESLDLMALDVKTGTVARIVSTPGDDTDPFMVDDDTIVFVSNQTGVKNLHVHVISENQTQRFTDVLGGIFHPSVSTTANRFAFSAFNEGGWDIFVGEDFSGTIESIQFPQEGETELISARGAKPGFQLVATPRVDETLPSVPRPGSETTADVVDAKSPAQAEMERDKTRPRGALDSADGTVLARLARAEEELARNGASPDDESADGGAETVDPAETADPAEAEVPAETADLAEGGVLDVADASGPDVPLFEPRTPVGTVEPYSLRWSFDPVGGRGGAVSYSSGLGLGFANVLSLSDLLGNHRMQFLVNFYGSLKYSDLAASYYYLKRRVNFAGGIFHYRNFINSNFTRLGEVFESSELFSERNYGLFGLASLPLTHFDRLDFELQAFVSKKTFFEYDEANLQYSEVRDQSDRLLQPSLSYIHDSAFYGRHGPVTGSRFLVSFSPAIPVSSKDVNRVTTFMDYRRYMRMWDRNSLALRFVGATSSGGTPRNFVVGGPGTLRGFDLYDFERTDASGNLLNEGLLGNNMLVFNMEYRFPFVDALFLGWPGRFAIGGVGAVAFIDVGSAFGDDFQPFARTSQGNLQLQDLNADIGFGIRANVGFLPLKFDWAWKSDLITTGGDVHYTFSIGPDF